MELVRSTSPSETPTAISTSSISWQMDSDSERSHPSRRRLLPTKLRKFTHFFTLSLYLVTMVILFKAGTTHGQGSLKDYTHCCSNLHILVGVTAWFFPPVLVGAIGYQLNDHLAKGVRKRGAKRRARWCSMRSPRTLLVLTIRSAVDAVLQELFKDSAMDAFEYVIGVLMAMVAERMVKGDKDVGWGGGGIRSIKVDEIKTKVVRFLFGKAELPKSSRDFLYRLISLLPTYLLITFVIASLVSAGYPACSLPPKLPYCSASDVCDTFADYPCQSWAMGGECSSNPTFMEINCRASCYAVTEGAWPGERSERAVRTKTRSEGGSIFATVRRFAPHCSLSVLLLLF